MLEDSSLSSSQATADASDGHANSPSTAPAPAPAPPTAAVAPAFTNTTNAPRDDVHGSGLPSTRKFIARPLNTRAGGRPPFDFYPRPLVHYRRQMDQLSRDLSRQSLSTESSKSHAPESVATALPQQNLPSSSTEQGPGALPSGPSLDPRPTACKKARRPTETRLSKNPSLQNLVTHMIDQGVQCNVQAPAPVAPVPPLPDPPASLPALPPVPANHQADGMMVDDNEEFSASNQYNLDKPISTIQFRRADGSRNCRKFDLPYKSASEAAIQCKGVKRNIPRRRKRPKAPRPPPDSTGVATPCPPVSV